MNISPKTFKGPISTQKRCSTLSQKMQIKTRRYHFTTNITAIEQNKTHTHTHTHTISDSKDKEKSEPSFPACACHFGKYLAVPQKVKITT